MQVLEAGTALHGQPVALADKRIPSQVRVLAGKQLYDVDAETLRTLREKAEAQILLARFLRGVFRKRATRRLGHFLHRDVEVLTQRPNSRSHLFDLRFHMRLPLS